MRQRALIAMALACEPQVLIADEPTTALDVMIQAQILELLAALRSQLGLSIIFVTHDLGVVAEMCDTVLVMYGGVTAEYADVDTVFNAPRHPYTRALLSVVPAPNPRRRRARIILQGETPNPNLLPTGCRFHPRCPVAEARCTENDPPDVVVGAAHTAACLLVERRAK